MSSPNTQNKFSIVRFYQRFLIILLVLAPIKSHAQTIFSQQQFDEVIERVKKGEPASIKLLPGTYKLSETITIQGALSIVGHGATISAYTDVYGPLDAFQETTTHYVCKLKHPLSEYSLIVDQSGSLVDVSESVNKDTHVNCSATIEGTYEKKWV